MRIDAAERYAFSFMYRNTQFRPKTQSTFRTKKVDSSLLVRLHWSIQNRSCTFNVAMFLIHGQAGRSIASHAGVFRGARFSSLPGKFCPGISFTICTNQFNLPKNDREGLNPVSKMALKKWITNFRLDIPSGKTGKSFQMFRCSRKFSDGTIQKVYGEGKRRNEFAEWHVAWLAEWHNYAECKI